jgi:hypothetical protein
MGNSRSGELEEFLDDAEEFEGNESSEVDVDSRKRAKKPVKGPKTTAWRDIEDRLEAKRLKRALSEFYDDDK